MSTQFLEGFDIGYHEDIPINIDDDDADFSDFLAGYREGVEMRRSQ